MPFMQAARAQTHCEHAVQHTPNAKYAQQRMAAQQELLASGRPKRERPPAGKMKDASDDEAEFESEEEYMDSDAEEMDSDAEEAEEQESFPEDESAGAGLPFPAVDGSKSLKLKFKLVEPDRLSASVATGVSHLLALTAPKAPDNKRAAEEENTAPEAKAAKGSAEADPVTRLQSAAAAAKDESVADAAALAAAKAESDEAVRLQAAANARAAAAAAATAAAEAAAAASAAKAAKAAKDAAAAIKRKAEEVAHAILTEIVRLSEERAQKLRNRLARAELAAIKNRKRLVEHEAQMEEAAVGSAA